MQTGITFRLIANKQWWNTNHNYIYIYATLSLCMWVRSFRLKSRWNDVYEISDKCTWIAWQIFKLGLASKCFQQVSATDIRYVLLFVCKWTWPNIFPGRCLATSQTDADTVIYFMKMLILLLHTSECMHTRTHGHYSAFSLSFYFVILDDVTS